MRKVISVFLLLAMICSILCACQTHGHDPHKNDTKPSTENQATEGSDSTEGTEPDNTEPEINPIPVDIETIGGVVIVGKIGFDEKGWMITSAQRNPDGSWDLHILKRPIEEPKQEAADDNNK